MDALNSLGGAATQAAAGNAYATRVMKTAIDSSASQEAALIKQVDQAGGVGRNLDTTA